MQLPKTTSPFLLAFYFPEKVDVLNTVCTYLPQLTMASYPHKPHLKLKIHLTHLAYHTLAYPTLNMLIYINLSCAKTSYTKPICNKELNISCKLLNTILKVKKRMVCGYRMVVYPHNCVADRAELLLEFKNIIQ